MENIFSEKTDIATEMEEYLEGLFKNYPKFTDVQNQKYDTNLELSEINKRLESLGYL